MGGRGRWRRRRLRVEAPPHGRELRRGGSRGETGGRGGRHGGQGAKVGVRRRGRRRGVGRRRARASCSGRRARSPGRSGRSGRHEQEPLPRLRVGDLVVGALPRGGGRIGARGPPGAPPRGESPRGGVVAPATSPPFAVGAAGHLGYPPPRREKRGSSSRELVRAAVGNPQGWRRRRTGARQDAGRRKTRRRRAHAAESLVGRGEARRRRSRAEDFHASAAALSDQT